MEYIRVGIITIIVVLVIVGLLVILYRYSVKLQAKQIVEQQPRVPMFECPKHGMIREEHLIIHLDNKLCPKCFDERLKVGRLDQTVN